MNKITLTLCILSLLVGACSNKLNSSSVELAREIPVLGGSQTKEIIIRTNNEIQKQIANKSNRIVLGNMTTNNSGSNISTSPAPSPSIASYSQKMSEEQKRLVVKLPDLPIFDTFVKSGMAAVAGGTAGATIGGAISAIAFGPWVATLVVVGSIGYGGFTAYQEWKANNEKGTSTQDQLNNMINLESFKQAKYATSSAAADYLSSSKFKIIKDYEECLSSNTCDSQKFISTNKDEITSSLIQSVEPGSMSKDMAESIVMDPNFRKGLRDNLSGNITRKNEVETLSRLKGTQKELKNTVEGMKAISKGINELGKSLDELVKSGSDNSKISFILLEGQTNIPAKELLDIRKERLAKCKDESCRVIEKMGVNIALKGVAISEEMEKEQKRRELYNDIKTGIDYAEAGMNIANNLGFTKTKTGKVIGKVVNTGVALAGAFIGTGGFSSPLFYLQSASILSNLLVDPQPDPLLVAIQTTLNEMREEMKINFKAINEKLDQIAVNLSNIAELQYIVHDDLRALILENTDINFGDIACKLVSDQLKPLNGKISMHDLKNIFIYHGQDETRQLDMCLKKIVLLFANNPLEYFKYSFKDSLSSNIGYDHKNFSEKNAYWDEGTNSYLTKNIFYNAMNAIHSTSSSEIYKKVSSSVDTTKPFLNMNRVMSEVNTLLKNVFFFDVASTYNNSNLWRIVETSEIENTVLKNNLAQKMLNNALDLINLAIFQQGVIDGLYIDNNFVKKIVDGSVDKNKEDIIKSLNTNDTLLENFSSYLLKMTSTDFDKKVGFGVSWLWGWYQIAYDDPTVINKLFEDNDIKDVNIPFNVVWVGDGHHWSHRSALSSTSSKQNGLFIQSLGVKGKNASQASNKLTIKFPIDEIISGKKTKLSNTYLFLLHKREEILAELVARKSHEILNSEEHNNLVKDLKRKVLGE